MASLSTHVPSAARLEQLQRQIEEDTRARIYTAVASLRDVSDHPAAREWEEEVRSIAAASSSSPHERLSRGPRSRFKQETPAKISSQVNQAWGGAWGVSGWDHQTEDDLFTRRSEDKQAPKATEPTKPTRPPSVPAPAPAAPAVRQAAAQAKKFVSLSLDAGQSQTRRHQRRREGEEGHDAFVELHRTPSMPTISHTMPFDVPVTPWEQLAEPSPTRASKNPTLRATLAATVLAMGRVEARNVEELLEQPAVVAPQLSGAPTGAEKEDVKFSYRMRLPSAQGTGRHLSANHSPPAEPTMAPEVGDEVASHGCMPSGSPLDNSVEMMRSRLLQQYTRPPAHHSPQRRCQSAGQLVAQHFASRDSLQTFNMSQHRHQTSTMLAGGHEWSASLARLKHNASEFERVATRGSWGTPARTPQATYNLVRGRPKTSVGMRGGKTPFVAGLVDTGAFSAAAASKRVARELHSSKLLRELEANARSSSMPANLKGRHVRYLTEAPTWAGMPSVSSRRRHSIGHPDGSW